MAAAPSGAPLNSDAAVAAAAAVSVDVVHDDDTDSPAQMLGATSMEGRGDAHMLKLPKGSSRRAVRIAPMGGAAAAPPPAVGDLAKGKRRGAPGGAPPPASSAEERMKQRRMLRNRESAARSRDKRRSKNMSLQADIARRRERIATIDSLVPELNELIAAARVTLGRI